MPFVTIADWRWITFCNISANLQCFTVWNQWNLRILEPACEIGPKTADRITLGELSADLQTVFEALQTRRWWFSSAHCYWGWNLDSVLYARNHKIALIVVSHYFSLLIQNRNYSQNKLGSQKLDASDMTGFVFLYVSNFESRAIVLV